MNHTLKRIFTAALLVFSALPGSALAIDFNAAPDFKVDHRDYNSGGGLSYLPSGDLLAFSANYASGPGLYLVDANRDGIPAQPVILLAQFDASTFPNFVQVSPSGMFAVFGVSGANSDILAVDLKTNSVEVLFSAPGNFDFSFIDDDKGYLSSNPGGFDPAQPNQIDLVTLSARTRVTVAKFFDTPSGAVTTNENGDLFYLKSTFLFPAPAQSFKLLKLSGTQLANAVVAATPLVESDAVKLLDLDGGYDIVYRNFATIGPELFFTAVGSELFRYVEGQSAAEVFLKVEDPTLPALSALAVLRPFERFDASGPSRSALAVSLTTDFFSTYSTIELKSATFDTDGDNSADADDQCPADPTKSAPLACGCGAPEIDSNSDGVVDCGSPRSFDKSISPQIAGQIGTFLLVESFPGEKAKYEFELRGPLPKQRLKKMSSRINFLDFSKLKSGTYSVRYRVSQKVGRKTVKSAWSAFQFIVRG